MSCAVSLYYITWNNFSPSRSVTGGNCTPGSRSYSDLTLVAEFWAFCLPVDCHCSFAVVTSRTWRCKETTGRRKGIRRFWLHHRDRRHALSQTYNNCVETHLGGGTLSLLSLHWAPYCSLIAIAMSTTMMWPNAIPCVNGHVAKLFSIWKLQIQPVTDLCRVL